MPPIRNNLWLTVENSLAVAWWDWLQWLATPEDQRGPEPAIDDWDKKALEKMSDLSFSFQAFKKATIPQLAPKDKWRMLSIFDVKVPQWIDAGFARHGRATEGGDLDVAGLWWWNPGDSICVLDDSYAWRPNQVVLFMPDECVAYDANGNCENALAATEIWDVSLLAGQPPREFPEI